MKKMRDNSPRSRAIPERMSGNEAVSYAIRQVNPDVMPAFPITPSTEIPQMVSTYIANGEVDTEFIPVESEHSAMSAAIGSEAAGARTMTATSSAGLALMWEELLLAASNRLPIVLTLVNRTLSGPININCDHSDGMGARDTGWIQIYSENNQEAYDNYIQAFPIAEDPRVHLPVMICQDGFITSHAVENISLLEDAPVKEFVGEYEPEEFLLNPGKPVAVGPYSVSAYAMEAKRAQEAAMERAGEVILEVAERFRELSGHKSSSPQAPRVQAFSVEGDRGGDPEERLQGCGDHGQVRELQRLQRTAWQRDPGGTFQEQGDGRDGQLHIRSRGKRLYDRACKERLL